MRVAFLSDVHGNAMALEVILEELERRGPFDAIIGGGDYVTRGADDAGVMRLLRQSSWTVYLRGNSEDRLLGVAAQRGLIDAPVSDDPGANENPLVRFALERLSSEDLSFLAQTEMTWETVGPSGERLLCAHATPGDPYRHLWPTTPAAEIDAILRRHRVDVYLYGHIHLAHVRRSPAGLVANAGSVGGPSRDRNTNPCFLIAEDEGEGWSLRHVTAPYDREAYLQSLARSGIPYAQDIITAHRTHRWDAG